jgi:predicted nucleic acid-binding protein
MEVSAVLLRKQRARALSEPALEDAILACQKFLLETHREVPAIGEIVGIARRYHLHAFDAMYFSLAHNLGIPIATLDGGIRTAARSHGVKLFAP